MSGDQAGAPSYSGVFVSCVVEPVSKIHDVQVPETTAIRGKGHRVSVRRDRGGDVVLVASSKSG